MTSKREEIQMLRYFHVSPSKSPSSLVANNFNICKLPFIKVLRCAETVFNLREAKVLICLLQNPHISNLIRESAFCYVSCCCIDIRAEYLKGFPDNSSPAEPTGSCSIMTAASKFPSYTHCTICKHFKFGIPYKSSYGH